MTYNFDPERWYDNERAYLDSRLMSGEISEDAYGEALEKLEKRIEEMWARLDGSYRINRH
ncbi:MAG: hypothetical protein LJE94_06245 [Deltaproteobacteria bacterium]|nr:hypothetical protein [Deltaproteobacteria bacterium]